MVPVCPSYRSRFHCIYMCTCTCQLQTCTEHKTGTCIYMYMYIYVGNYHQTILKGLLLVLFLIKIDIWCLHSNDGLVQQPKSFLDVLWLDLLLAIQPSHGLRETNHALKLSHCDSPRRPSCPWQLSINEKEGVCI